MAIANKNKPKQTQFKPKTKPFLTPQRPPKPKTNPIRTQTNPIYAGQATQKRLLNYEILQGKKIQKRSKKINMKSLNDKKPANKPNLPAPVGQSTLAHRNISIKIPNIKYSTSKRIN